PSSIIPKHTDTHRRLGGSGNEKGRGTAKEQELELALRHHSRGLRGGYADWSGNASDGTGLRSDSGSGSGTAGLLADRDLRKYYGMAAAPAAGGKWRAGKQPGAGPRPGPGIRDGLQKPGAELFGSFGPKSHGRWRRD